MSHYQHDVEDGATTPDPREPRNVDTNYGEGAEQRMRTRGGWMAASGGGVIALVLFSNIIWHAGFGDNMPGVYAMPLYGIGFGLVYLGAMEMMFRQYRAVQRGVHTELQRLEHGLRLLVQMLPEEMQQRWYAGYGSGHQDGRQYRTGTDDGPGRRSGDVLRMRPRTRPGEGTTGHPSR